MTLTMEIDLDRLSGPRADEVGRILRYWGGAAKQLDLSTSLEQPLLDSAYQLVGMLRVA